MVRDSTLYVLEVYGAPGRFRYWQDKMDDEQAPQEK